MVTSAIDRRDALHGGQQIKHPCRCVAASDITLSGFQTIDGIALDEDDANLRVLVTGQTDTTENGIYNASSGVWERAKDFNGNRDVVQGTLIYVLAGTTYASTLWRVTTADPIVIDTSVIAFTQYPPLVTDDLNAIEALVGTSGLLAKTAANTWALRTLQPPAAGITITNPAGVAGDPTFVLANDLLAVEGLSSTGIAARTGTDTWAVRTITAGDGITITNGSGASGNPTIALTSSRITLTGNLTIYVRKDGSDSNDGLTDTAGGAKLTIQAAINLAEDEYDFNGFTVTIQVRTGTYTENIAINARIGGGVLALLGDTSTPTNVVLIGSSTDTITMGASGAIVDLVTINGFEIRANSGDYGINNQATGHLEIGANMVFGTSTSATAHMAVTWRTAQIHAAAYTISGNADRHIDCDAGIIQCNATPVISGSRTFGTFARWRNHGHLICLGTASTGSVTGTRFSGEENGCANVNGTAATYFPGNANGTLIGGAVISGTDAAYHGAVLVGVADTSRAEINTSAQFASRIDTAGSPAFVSLNNFGITSTNQGGSLSMQLGSGGTSGGAAMSWQCLTTEDWSTAANRSAKMRFNVRTDNSLTAELDVSQGVTVGPDLAVQSGGSLLHGFKATTTSQLGIFFGSSAPNIAAAKGSLYLRTNGSGTNDRAFIATGATGSTASWTALQTSA